MINRRQLLVGSGIASLAIGVGCAPATPPGGPVKTQEQAALPSTSTTWPVDYDHPGSPDGIIAPFLYRYPTPPPQTVAEPPGDSSTITAACQLNTPGPVPMATNPAWQAINKSLAATLDVQFTPGKSWDAKLQTILAGNDFPDLLQLTQVPRLPELLPSRFADLSEHLGGDAVNTYPNLALLGEAAWRHVQHAGGLFGVPQPRNRADGAPFRIRADVFEQLGIATNPTSGAELESLMREVTNPKEKRWASALVTTQITAFATMFDAPNTWELRDGRLLHEYESEQYTAALDRVRALWADGVFHPESFTSMNPVGLFDNAQTVMEYGSFDALPRRALGIAQDPNYRAGFMIMPRYEGGGVANVRLASGYYGMTVIPKDTPPERVKMLLRILDWIAAPAGTAEYLLRQYGQDGRHYTIDDDGILATTSKASAEIVVLGYLATGRPVYVPPEPSLRTSYDDFYAALVKQHESPKDNPVNGMWSETDRSATAWVRRLADLASEIVKGAKPVTEWTSTIGTWRKEVGDQIREEYTALLGDH